MRLPDLEKLKKSDSDDPEHDMEASKIVASSSVWFPERLTYILSNLSSLFPSLDTLEVRISNTVYDSDDSFDFFLMDVPGEVEESSYHRVLEKLLNLTFSAIAQNGLNDGQGSLSQRIKHFSVSEYPPFPCDAIRLPHFRSFISNLVSFSLEIDDYYNLDEGGYMNENLEFFMANTLPDMFLQPLYSSSSLQNLKLQALNSCCLGTHPFVEFLSVRTPQMGSLRTLVMNNIILSDETFLTDLNGLAGIIKANSSTLEVIEMDGAGWHVPDDVDWRSGGYWASFFAFLREHLPVTMRRLAVNDNIIDKCLDDTAAKPPQTIHFRYERLDPGWGFLEVENSEETIQFRRDLTQWNLLRNAILDSPDKVK